jgi:general secretion pathway protein E
LKDKIMTALNGRPVRNDLVSRFLKELSDCESQDDTIARNVSRRDLTHTLLRDALKSRASDIHLEPQSSGSRLRFRIDGIVSDVAHLTHTQAKLILNQFKAMADLDPVAHFTPQDAHATCILSEAKLDVRLSLAPCLNGETVSLRLLNSQRIERSIGELGLTVESKQRLENWLSDCNGMFLAAGPTSSGKTTTVYSLLHELKFTDRRIISFEDPVEYEIDGITQIELDQPHHLSFAEGVKSMLRLDPDYLMLGEIRDAGSAHSAVSAAISGRVLLSTIHSRDAVGAVTALRNWGLQDHEIAEALSVVVAQRLVRKLCPHCRQRVTPSDADLAWLKGLALRVPKKVWQPRGCEQCRGLGYLGRTGVFEFWRLDSIDYDMILGRSTEQQLRQHLCDQGHISLLADGLTKIGDGTTTVAEIKRMGATSFTSRPAVPRRSLEHDESTAHVGNR